MEALEALFGTGDALRTHQMAARAFVIFFLAMGLVRLSGRRSFGMKSPLDIVITILLGATLSRALVGASPFVPTVAAGFVLVALHRLLTWLGLRYAALETFFKGSRRLLYKEGTFHRGQMEAALISDEDILEGMVTKANVDALERVKAIYLERDGEIGVVKKTPEPS